LDFIPTICDLVGINTPKELTGISLKPYLTGQGPKPTRKFIVTEDYNSYQINDGRYKYTVYELPGHPETLTDIKINPGETKNYCNDVDYTKIKSFLKKELMADLSKRGLTPLPEDRTIQNIRAAEKALNLKKGSKSKSKEEE
jgi:arylsulfatase A-like enzyme